jgi:5,10-methylenetetrahydromethanopterin reductase
MMRFGIRFNSESGPIREIVRRAQIAEDLGFDDVWYCQDLMKRDAWVALTAIAAATTRVRVGTCIANPFSTSPAELAMRAATLQEFSDGRFVLGIGPGDPPYLEWVGLKQERPRTGVAEAVAIVRALLAGTPIPEELEVFANWDQHVKLRMPIPATPVPIYIGGQGPKILELSGEVADGSLPIVFPPETIGFVRERIAAGAARAGRSLEGFDLAACVWWSVAETRREAEDALRYLIAYYGPSLRSETLAPIGLLPADFDAVRVAWQSGDMSRAMGLLDERMFRLAIYGDPEAMLERVHWLAEQGVTQVNLGPPLGANPEQALRITGEQVIARMR